ncbi:MAG TPA: sodium:solute symporter [Bacteroidia bacterium]|nr:sodium:solute symporter [Bacteroidia bacterium]
MSPWFIIACIGLYFSLLLIIAWFTSKKATNESYFTGNHVSPWIAVAFGMIGDSLSGVTFISVPGQVGQNNFYYLQLVLGYFAGYFVVSRVLLPVYYKMNLVSIYTYLFERFGVVSQKSGAFFFILSRVLGAAGRLFLAASVIQLFVFDAFGVPFALSVAIIISLMLLYTYKGGIKTLVWTDTLQSGFLLLGVIFSIVFIANDLNYSGLDLIQAISSSKYAQVFDFDWFNKSNFFKQFLGGAFITIAMTGLDQNMMQKNLSCKSLKDAQKNMESFSLVMVLVNVFFLSLGALLYIYAEQKGVSIPLNPVSGKPDTDKLFPMLALQYLGSGAGLVFIIGLTAATFSSADSVLTTLTTSFYLDFLNIEKSHKTEVEKTQIRKKVHFGFALLLLVVILIFRAMNSKAIIDTVLMIASFTYGPLLGLFAFGIFTQKTVNDKYVWIICLVAPILCYILNENSINWFYGYKFGYELLLLNGLLTFMGLAIISVKAKNTN